MEALTVHCSIPSNEPRYSAEGWRILWYSSPLVASASLVLSRNAFAYNAHWLSDLFDISSAWFHPFKRQIRTLSCAARPTKNIFVHLYYQHVVLQAKGSCLITKSIIVFFECTLLIFKCKIKITHNKIMVVRKFVPLSSIGDPRCHQWTTQDFQQLDWWSTWVSGWKGDDYETVRMPK